MHQMSPTEFGLEPDPSNNSSSTSQAASVGSTALQNSSKQPCVMQDFTTALITFQKNYRLNLTGECDERTTTQMSQRRCGQPDTIIDKLDSDPSPDHTPERKTRSLTDIISENVELEELKELRKQQLQEYMDDIERENKDPKPAGTQPKVRVRRSQIQYSMSSDYGALISKRRVSWKLMREHMYPIISHAAQRSILRQAFRYWSEVTPLCFYESNSSRVDVEIGFLEGMLHSIVIYLFNKLI